MSPITQQKLTQLPGLYIAESDIAGRGVFCLNDITSGSLIEVCPAIILSADDTIAIHKTKLHDYYFLWDSDAKTSAIALGYGSLYNHSATANADFELVDSEEIRIIATRDIIAGSEITINYQGQKMDEYPLWF